MDDGRDGYRDESWILRGGYWEFDCFSMVDRKRSAAIKNGKKVAFIEIERG
jgi:hypothetical protein